MLACFFVWGLKAAFKGLLFFDRQINFEFDVVFDAQHGWHARLFEIEDSKFEAGGGLPFSVVAGHRKFDVPRD